MIDLRSDTVTRPTATMRRVMADAEVGDDVYDDDPSIHRLQEKAATLMGKEAGLFMPSGSMSNAVAIRAHTKPGDEVLMDREAHSLIYEVGMPATIAQVVTRQFRSVKAVPVMEDIADWMHEETLHSPGTSLLLLENTHNRAGGAIIPLEVCREVRRLTQEREVTVHLDGARLFNAAVATGIPAAEYAACADSVTFCLSKGLGCPVGSVLCGSREFIEKARRVRKMLGGGMRQAGILAAAGIYALDNHIARLADDHALARVLARGLADAPGICLEDAEPPTNMVYFQPRVPHTAFVAALKAQGVLANTVGTKRIRLVTHLDVNRAAIEQAISVLREVGRATL